MRYGSIMIGLAAIVLVWATVGHAAKDLEGAIVKLEKEFVTVEVFGSGEIVKAHFDGRTKVMGGELEEGAIVEIRTNAGHAESIQVVEDVTDSEDEDEEDDDEEEDDF